jgi:transposase
MGQVVVVGLDIAKSVFQVHGVDRAGEVVVRRRLRRSRVLWFFAPVEPCPLRLNEVGMIKSTPNQIIAEGTDWRFLNELKRELKA